MNILIAVHHFPPAHNAGAEQRALHDEELTEIQDGKPTIAVPLFGRWIRTKA